LRQGGDGDLKVTRVNRFEGDAAEEIHQVEITEALAGTLVQA
jgi:hypothetical protein